MSPYFNEDTYAPIGYPKDDGDLLYFQPSTPEEWEALAADWDVEQDPEPWMLTA